MPDQERTFQLNRHLNTKLPLPWPCDEEQLNHPNQPIQCEHTQAPKLTKSWQQKRDNKEDRHGVFSVPEDEVINNQNLCVG